jgi:prophage antirepressor-like protein
VNLESVEARARLSRRLNGIISENHKRRLFEPLSAFDELDALMPIEISAIKRKGDPMFRAKQLCVLLEAKPHRRAPVRAIYRQCNQEGKREKDMIESGHLRGNPRI